ILQQLRARRGGGGGALLREQQAQARGRAPKHDCGASAALRPLLPLSDGGVSDGKCAWAAAASGGRWGAAARGVFGRASNFRCFASSPRQRSTHTRPHHRCPHFTRASLSSHAPIPSGQQRETGGRGRACRSADVRDRLARHAAPACGCAAARGRSRGATRTSTPRSPPAGGSLGRCTPPSAQPSINYLANLTLELVAAAPRAAHGREKGKAKKRLARSAGARAAAGAAPASMDRAASTSRPTPLAPPDARRVCVFIVNPRGGGGAGAGSWARARAVVERRLSDVYDIQACA
ncbi:MAG: hypothetical protein RL334_733, partial [Chloroflexota bacterium]